MKKGLDRLRALNEQMLKEAQKRRDKEPERIIEELSGVPPFAFGQDKQYAHARRRGQKHPANGIDHLYY